LGDGRKDRRKNDGSRSAIEFRQEFLFVAIVQGAQVHEGTDHRGPIAQKEVERYEQDGKPDEEFDHEGDRTAPEADQMGLKVSQQVIEVLSDLFGRRIGNFLEDSHKASSGKFLSGCFPRGIDTPNGFLEARKIPDFRGGKRF